MSDHGQKEFLKNEMAFPMIIAITALVLALVSGVVNYRQNSLADLETNLIEQKDQLQMAMKDMADFKMKTIQLLVEAELALKSEQKIRQEKEDLTADLADANSRIRELEEMVKRLDQKLEMKKKRSKKKKRVKKKTVKKVKSKPVVKKKAAEVKAKATAPVIKAADPVAKTVKQAAPIVPPVTTESDMIPVVGQKPALKEPSAKVTAVVEKDDVIAAQTVDLEVYPTKIARQLQKAVGEQLLEKGFNAKFPEPDQDMKMTDATTVFYYHDSYAPVAQKLVAVLSDITKGKVLMRKGATPHKANKMIVHLIGN